MSDGRVLVIGGGLAGQTAALRCRDAGLSVTLLEARPRLGGATCSFRRDGMPVDTGQHVVLRCYSAYRDLLRRLDVSNGVLFQHRLHIPITTPGGRSWTLRCWPLPAPAHLTPALAGHRALTTGQRMRAAGTALALRDLDPADPELDRISFGEWLRSRGEPPNTVRALWGLFTVAALNAQPDGASLGLAARVFRTGLLDDRDAGNIGIPQLPLGDMHDVAARHALDAGGVPVRTRTKATEVHRTETGLRVLVRGSDGIEGLDADSVIVAVPHETASKLLQNLPLPGAEGWSQLSSSPIVNVHVVYDRTVTRLPMVAALDSPVQWVFDRTATSGLRSGQHLAISLSAADEFVDARSGDLRELFLPALRDLFPAAADAAVLDFFVTREPSATFRQAPGSQRWRPSAHTCVPGLVLAGAWTDTGLPDTIEGAVTSGDTAAEVVISAHGKRSAHGAEVSA